jgi:hypothetical protein
LQSYGPKTVDIATYASNFSTVKNNQFGTISLNQNSYAAPIVSGTIALMYAHFCESILDEIQQNPKQTLSQIKQIILMNADTLPFLKNKIVSGAKLNTGKIIKYIKGLESKAGLLDCKTNSIIENNTEMPFEILWNTNGELSFLIENQNSFEVNIIDFLGKTIINKNIKNSDFINLNSCSNGVYLILIQDASGQKWSKKIVKLNDK